MTAPEKPGRLVATRDCTAKSPQGTKCDGRVFVRTADVPATTTGELRRVEVARCSVCDTSPCPRCKQRTLDPTRKNCRGCGRNLSPAR